MKNYNVIFSSEDSKLMLEALQSHADKIRSEGQSERDNTNSIYSLNSRVLSQLTGQGYEEVEEESCAYCGEPLEYWTCVSDENGRQFCDGICLNEFVEGECRE